MVLLWRRLPLGQELSWWILTWDVSWISILKLESCSVCVQNQTQIFNVKGRKEYRFAKMYYPAEGLEHPIVPSLSEEAHLGSLWLSWSSEKGKLRWKGEVWTLWEQSIGQKGSVTNWKWLSANAKGRKCWRGKLRERENRQSWMSTYALYSLWLREAITDLAYSMWNFRI